MLMIPLPFVIALFVAVVLVFEFTQRGFERRSGWLLACLALFTFQEILVGLRFGYGFDNLLQLQPFSAALIPPLAYFSFRRPQVEARLVIHLVPLALVILVVMFDPRALDAVLALNNLGYGTLLLMLGLGGADRLPWMETHRIQQVLTMLWIFVTALLVSAIADAAIAFDFMLSQGNNTGRIAGWATVLGLSTGLIGVIVSQRRTPESAAAATEGDPADSQTFADLGALMQSERLHLDPDINLNRIARRLVRPVRDVSRAVNQTTDGNVSQYINRLRIEEACTLLADTDTPITQIVFAAGFNTKSNFNREFSRVTGQSPSEWRRGARKT